MICLKESLTLSSRNDIFNLTFGSFRRKYGGISSIRIKITKKKSDIFVKKRKNQFDRFPSEKINDPWKSLIDSSKSSTIRN